MLENPYCFRCDSQNLKSKGFAYFNKDKTIEIEELECLDCGFIAKMPLSNRRKIIKKSIENLTMRDEFVVDD